MRKVIADMEIGMRLEKCLDGFNTGCEKSWETNEYLTPLIYLSAHPQLSGCPCVSVQAQHAIVVGGPDSSGNFICTRG